MMVVLFLIIVLFVIISLFSIESFASGTPFFTMIRNSPCGKNPSGGYPSVQEMNRGNEFGINPCQTGDYVTNYPFGYPPVEYTKPGAYCPQAQWNYCGGQQRIWKHF